MTKPVSTRICRSVGEAATLLRLLANSNRLAIVCQLMEAEASVSALEHDLGIMQPTLSQQIAELREAGIIRGRREGRSMVYRIADHRAEAIVETLRQLFSGLDDVTGRHVMRRVSLDEMMFD